jgi:hypothetical protein
LSAKKRRVLRLTPASKIGGLPGDGWTGADALRGEGEFSGSKSTLVGENGSGEVVDGVTSKQKFQDFELHLEFRLAFMPNANGQARSNRRCGTGSVVPAKSRRSAAIPQYMGQAPVVQKCFKNPVLATTGLFFGQPVARLRNERLFSLGLASQASDCRRFATVDTYERNKVASKQDCQTAIF